jgi:hypothetical protein
LVRLWQKSKKGVEHSMTHAELPCKVAQLSVIGASCSSFCKENEFQDYLKKQTELHNTCSMEEVKR